MIMYMVCISFFFFSSRRRHTRWNCDWSSDVCSSDLAANPAAQLVELSQAEGVGSIDDQGVGVRDVEPRLDDGGAEEQIRLPVHEAEHHPLQLLLLHLAVPHGDPRLRDDSPEVLGHRADRLHTVVDEEDL